MQRSERQLYNDELVAADDWSDELVILSAGVGFDRETDAAPYDSGPQLAGAKLNHVSEESGGEGGFGVRDSAVLPNDEFALYGGDYRLRVLTGGSRRTDSPASPRIGRGTSSASTPPAPTDRRCC